MSKSVERGDLPSLPVDSPVGPGDVERISEPVGDLPLVSVVVPAFNEAAIVQENLTSLCSYLDSLADTYRWEMIIVNDGSTDATPELAEEFAAQRDNVSVLHHRTNFGLGQAFQFAFGHCRGDYVVTLDIDLSYSAEHIEELLDTIQKTGARVVTASPYAKGGQISAVPWLRRTLSIWANRFLSLAAEEDLSTLTSMVRAYDARFLRKLSLRSMGMEINPEILYKSMLLQGRIEEIPAHLDWSLQQTKKGARRSSMRMIRHTVSVLLSGFLFRPVMFFILPGLGFLAVAAYASTWVLIHFLDQYQNLTQVTWFMGRISAATAEAFQQAPHTFLVAGMSLMLSIQLVSLGILALQNRSYFEEIFYLGSSLLGVAREEQVDRQTASSAALDGSNKR